MTDLDPIERRRKRRESDQRATFAIVAVIGAAFLFVAVIAGGIAAVVLWRNAPKDPAGGVLSAVAGPTPAREGETWTHRELAAYIKSRGVGCEMDMTRRGMIFAETTAAIKDVRFYDEQNYSFGKVRCVATVTKMDTPQSAKDLAGMEKADAAFSWGRFCFQSTDTAYLARLKKALGE